jgi:hypothetical protein
MGIFKDIGDCSRWRLIDRLRHYFSHVQNTRRATCVHKVENHRRGNGREEALKECLRASHADYRQTVFPELEIPLA